MQRNNLTFRKDSFLGQITDESWQELSNAWTKQSYKNGQFLISQEDHTNRDVFFILKGRAKATIYTDRGREVSFVIINRGDSFGEFSAIDNSPRSASVIATQDCIAATILQDEFVDIVRKNSDISYAFMKTLIKHLRHLSSRVVDFNSKTVNQRLYNTLLDIGQQTQRPGHDHVEIDQPPTQLEIAAFIFSSRENVAREMGRLRQLGLIDRNGRSLIIPSLSKLKAFIANPKET